MNIAQVSPSSGSRLDSLVATLNPAYFGMVMATGIVSIACNLLDLTILARVLFFLNFAILVLLWALTACRIKWHLDGLLKDLVDHQRGVGYFTCVAATGVFGSQLVLLWHAYTPAAVLWLFSLILWISLTYAIFTAFTIKEHKPPLSEGINGGWLLAVVSTQSVAILGNLIVPALPGYDKLLLFLTLAFWLYGGMLYIWLISLIFYRYTFFAFSPSDFAPPYWINMGAVSISTLCGTRLIDNAATWKFLQEILPFVKGFTLLFWATGTWWIPMLVILAIWRHAVKKVPVAYDPGYWALVFPLGMYTVATYRLSFAIGLPELAWISRIFILVALLAWLLTFCGFLHRLWKFMGKQVNAL